MAKPGLKVWRAMPKARRQNLKQKGVDTRREKAQFGRQLARSRKQGTPGPTAKGVARGRRGAKGAAAAEVEPTTGGVEPRGIRVERTRKTTTAGGKVGVVRTGETAGRAGPEAYRQFTPSRAGGGAGRKAGRLKGAKPKAGKAKMNKGRAKGPIKNPNVGGPGKRLVARGGGGRAALQTLRQMPNKQAKALVQGPKTPQQVVKALRRRARK